VGAGNRIHLPSRCLRLEPRPDLTARRLARSKNKNEVRQNTSVAGLIARSPSPAPGSPEEGFCSLELKPRQPSCAPGRRQTRTSRGHEDRRSNAQARQRARGRHKDWKRSDSGNRTMLRLYAAIWRMRGKLYGMLRNEARITATQGRHRAHSGLGNFTCIALAGC
jgi:hypothetical protein